MKTFLRLSAAAAALVTASAGYAQSGISINVTPWSAPNAYGSPSYEAATQNQFAAERAGATTAGTPGTPTYYQAITGPVSYGAFIATNFNSWMGVADPGAPYQNELGNRIHYGLFINGNGQQFSISQLSFAFDGNGASNYFDYDFGQGYQYSPYDGVGGYVGILKGKDGILGTSDDVFVTDAPDTTLVDALIGRGTGMADAVYCGVPTGAPDEPNYSGPCGAGNQGYINDEITAIQQDGFNQLTGTYRLLDGNGDAFATGAATVNFSTAPVPEPATWGMMIAGFGLVGGALRRRRMSVRLA